MDLSHALTRLSLVDKQGLHRVADPELVELACEIAACYTELIPSYTPRPRRITHKHAALLYKAAELCKSRTESAALFTKRQLEGMAHVGKFWLSGLAAPSFPGFCSQHNMSWVRSLRYYKSQLQIFECWCRMLDPRLIIQDQAAPFSPLFRAAMAALHGHKDLIDMHRDSALMELEGAPAAKQIFDNLEGILHDRG